MYLVDTNVLSEARRGSNEARTWLRSVDPSTVYLSVALKRRTDARTAASLTVWLEQLRHDHSERILPISDRVALEWGRLAAERPRSMADALIAATAAIHSKIIVTRNVDDFADSRIPVINPWESS